MNETPLNETPLFIAMKGCYFDQFESGTKSIEYRRYGGQWTEQHCRPGRLVTLSRGYNGRRLSAVIVGFETRVMDTEIYGRQQLLALIHLRLAEPASMDRAATQLPPAAA